MDTGPTYLTLEGSSTASSGSPDSLNCLKFGQKIYFEDAGLGVSGKSAGSGSPAPANKGGRRAVRRGQPPKCQVEGCKVDLSEAKAYYSRHRVCLMHSKSSNVVVAGLPQRFCQQCSRFHLLNEFDQGKRSCRRRLAGHNERRRKPPPGSLLSSRLGRLSSSLFSGGDGGSRNGGFLLDFSSYQRHSGKDPWLSTKATDRFPGTQSTSTGKYPHTMWSGHCDDPSPEMYLQGSAGISVSSGECITNVTADSNCALSLLSNQTWGSRTRPGPSSSIGLGSSNNTGLMNLDGATMAISVTMAHLSSSNPSSPWGFRANEGFEPAPEHVGHCQISHNQQFNGGDVLMDQFHNGGRHYMEEVDHHRTSSGSSHSHWSL